MNPPQFQFRSQPMFMDVKRPVIANGETQGLSDSVAAERLEKEGPNELPAAKPKSTLAIAAEVVSEPMFLLLIATGTVYLVLGSVEEAVALGVSILVIIGITLYQQTKTERTLQALRDLSSPRALVIRGGHKKRIAGREVVRGDILVLSEGDRVPADALVLSSVNLTAEESLLTGESMPVRKAVWDRESEMPVRGLLWQPAQELESGPEMRLNASGPSRRARGRGGKTPFCSGRPRPSRSVNSALPCETSVSRIPTSSGKRGRWFDCSQRSASLCVSSWLWCTASPEEVG